jgi:prolyl oligopeptidase
MPVTNNTHPPAVDILHGIPISDPYRWLEDRSLPATSDWITLQRQIHDDYFSRVPGMAVVRRLVERYLDVETVEQPARIADLYFFRRRRRGEEQASIVLRDLHSDLERTLVDPSPLGPLAAVTIHSISDDGKTLAYERRHGGEKTAAIHFVDVDSGRSLDDHLETGLLRGLAFDPNHDGFYYCHETAEDVARRRPHQIRHHLFGDPVSSDRVLFSAPRAIRSRLILFSDEFCLGAVYCHEMAGTMRVDLHRAMRAADQLWQPVFHHRMAPYGPLFYSGRMFVYSCAEAPLGTILELNDDGSEGRPVVPEWKAQIRSTHFFGDRILVTYLVDLSPVVHVHSLDGDFLGALPTPRDGSFALLRSLSTRCDSLFASSESFHRPLSILEFDRTLHTPSVRVQRDGALDQDLVQVRRVTYPSKDGTAIPMFLLTPEGKDPSSPGPVILTAYGGFGMSMTPRFSALVSVMLELGAVFALANIRGGGEFGRSWHEAARGRRRQVAIDDFIAAAEWLQSKRITSPGKLAIFGGSNSGLLVAAAMTQRPELFQAVLAMAPILDMVRYETFGEAGSARSEYGTVDDPEDFKALYAYSPYHRVSDNINYPATLFVSGDKDSICDPAHTRKMAARLQDRSVQLNPVLVDYDPSRGHTAVLPLSMRIDALSRRIAFLCHHLGISIPKEDVHASAHP